jgi:beta-galactosidase GanA
MLDARGALKRSLRLQRFLAISLMCAFVFTPAYGQSESSARVRIDKASGQLLLQGKPFLILGGELGNSSAGTSAEADATLPDMARLHVNTVLMPVAWEQVEPREGTFDFSILDHWIDVARQQNLHLVLLWFGSWKNAFSEYAPDWVKSDTKRFSRESTARPWKSSRHSERIARNATASRLLRF